MPVTIDEVVGNVEPEAPSQRGEEQQVQEPAPADLEKLREEIRRLERREARLRAN